MAPKIAVFGTGANGSCIAASMIDAGHDVTMIDQWPEHVDTMRRNGLTISMPEQELHVKVRAHHLCDVCTFQEPFDVVLLAVKAYDTRWACEMIKPHVAESGMVIGMQNCMVAGIIREVIGPERSIACVLELSSEMFTPGQVKRNTPPKKTWIGLGLLEGGPAHRGGARGHRGVRRGFGASGGPRCGLGPRVSDVVALRDRARAPRDRVPPERL